MGRWTRADGDAVLGDEEEETNRDRPVRLDTLPHSDPSAGEHVLR